MKILFLLFRMLIFWLATALGTVWAQTPHPEVEKKVLKLFWVILGGRTRFEAVRDIPVNDD